MFVNHSASSWKYTGPSFDLDVENFHRRLPDYNITPLVDLPEVAEELGLGHVLIKDESNRLGLPAFKILGASWAIYKAAAVHCNLPLTISLEELGMAASAKGLKLVACTAGNWGRAVSRMAKYLQIPATIFVPNTMDQATRNRISSEGAKVVVVDGNYEMSIEAAKKEAKTENTLLVMDVSWEGYEEFPQARHHHPWEQALLIQYTVGRGRIQYDANRDGPATGGTHMHASNPRYCLCWGRKLGSSRLDALQVKNPICICDSSRT
jgi:diaminopropionate ammonia-lyase